jgi:hypothetical protein
MKKLKLTMNGVVLYAKTHNDHAPNLIAAIEKSLPVTGLVRHARVCDMEWELPVPWTIDTGTNENLRIPRQGDIVYFPPAQMICGWYGDADYAPPLGPCNVIATIYESDFFSYKKLFSDVWRNPGVTLTLEMA